MEPSNVHRMSSVCEKHGPPRRITVPPRILPTVGVDVRGSRKNKIISRKKKDHKHC